MPEQNILNYSLSELSDMLENKGISAVEISSAYLGMFRNHGGKINCYITVNEDMVIADARKSDERRSAGNALSRYDGIPIAVKDNICTQGVRTTCASRILENFIPPYDATSYAKLKAAGFILFGKTNMDEFAMGSSTENSYFGVVKNPYNTGKVPGGSSGGSAAAVSARMAPAALGSDTGGSIRQPAAFCGVTGIKPTYGRVSRYGLVAFASSLDQIGSFGKNVADAALLLSAVSGYDEKDSTSVDREIDFAPEHITGDIKGMKIGIPDEYFIGCSGEITAKIGEKVELLRKGGADIRKISLKYIDYAVPVYYLIATAEASSNLARYDGVRYGYRSPGVSGIDTLYNRTRSEGFGKEVKRRIILGTFSLSSGYYDAYYLKALKGRTLIIEDFVNAFREVDAIITPTTTATAFGIGEMSGNPLQMYMSDILTISANLAGIPGISVPIGLDSSGMPMGLQIMGNHFNERAILNVGSAVEKICDPVKPEM